MQEEGHEGHEVAAEIGNKAANGTRCKRQDEVWRTGEQIRKKQTGGHLNMFICSCDVKY